MTDKAPTERMLTAAAEEITRLKRRDRQVYRVGEVPDDILAAIQAAEPPPESEALERAPPDTPRKSSAGKG